MEKLLKTELLKNSEKILKKAHDLSPSYQTMMRNALLNFDHLGIPSRDNEDWKYTNIVKNLAPRFFEEKENISQNNFIPNIVIDKKGMIIFNNGIFNKYLSVLPTGIEIDTAPLSEQFYDAFDSLNFGVALSPLSLKIKKNTVINFPISVVHVTNDEGVNKIISPRLTITAEENTKAHFLECFTSSKNETLQYSTNAVTTFILKKNASIEHVKIQSEAKNAIHIGLTKAELCDHASFKSITLDFGQLTARHNINVDLNESGATTSVHGLYNLKKNEHADIFSTITHHSPHTQSEQLFKGILGDESHGIFTGKIVIAKNAQQSSSEQLNKNLLLSKKAHVDTRPQLLVNADDVKCSHGATVGQLSSEEEFYLESRGIPKEKAKNMLCQGFALDVILKIENPLIKKLASELLVKEI